MKIMSDVSAGVPRHNWVVRVLRPARGNLDERVVPGLPLAAEVAHTLVLANALWRGLELLGVVFIDRPVGDAERLPVLQANGIDERELFGPFWEHQSEPCCKHSAHRMAHDVDPIDVEKIEKTAKL